MRRRPRGSAGWSGWRNGSSASGARDLPKHPPRPAIRFRDDRGQELDATWSRSGRRLILTLGNHVRVPFGQVLLDPELTEELSAFLANEPPHPGLELVDEEARELTLEWSANGRRLVAVALPALDLDGVVPWQQHPEYRQQPTQVELRPDQVEELASFIRGGP